MKAGVLVIGGGLAGVTAALAAKEAGRSVLVVRRAPGATALSSGAFDVAPDPTVLRGRPMGQGTASSASAEALAARRPFHPYAVLGASGRALLPEAMRFVLGRLAAAGLHATPFDPEAPALALAEPFGGLRLPAAAQASQGRLDLRRASGARVGVVDLLAHRGLDAPLVLAGLRALGVEAEAVAVGWPGDEDAPFLLPFDLARLLDDEPGRVAFVEAAKPALAGRGLTHLVLPPVAGTGDPAAVCDAIGAALGIEVVEGLGTDASVPGLRLHHALERALAAAGIPLESGTVRATDGLVLRRGRDEEPLEAEAIVLASGRFIGGGVERQGGLREPVFGLPVFVDDRLVDEDPVEHLTRDGAAAPQALFRAGIAVDASLRPLDTTRSPAREDLFAAGEVIGGYDPPADGSGLGVAVLTGFIAGRRAAGSS